MSNKFSINLCRICLIEKGKISLFEKYDEDIPANLLETITGIKIDYDSNLPNQICETCLSNVNIAIKLKLDVVNSEIKIKEYLGSKQEVEGNQPNIVKCMVESESLDDADIKSEDDSDDDDEDNVLDDDCSFEPNDEDSLSNDVIPEKPKVKRKRKNGSKEENGKKKRIRKVYTSKETKCKECGKEFNCHANLVNHLRIHTGEKPYECDICFQKYSQHANLIVHKRKHTQEKPYVCEICSKQFSQAGNLNQHRLTHRTERNYKCDMCEKSFLHSKALKAHISLHSEEKKHVCKDCGKSFPLKNYLTRHVRTVHFQEKNHVCSECGKAFSNSGNLKAHIRIHTGEKPFECMYCDSKFNQSTPLVRHMQQHKKNKDKIKEPSDNGKSFDGYLKRQALYSRLTCISESRDDPSKRAGVCLACYYNYHECHEVVELYTKRNFRCDCGNSKYKNATQVLCNLGPCERDAVNQLNEYIQNFSGYYCTYHRPYPDTDDQIQDAMLQCCVCEDWFYERHLGTALPAIYDEMVCNECMEKYGFFKLYFKLMLEKDSESSDQTLDRHRNCS